MPLIPSGSEQENQHRHHHQRPPTPTSSSTRLPPVQPTEKTQQLYNRMRDQMTLREQLDLRGSSTNTVDPGSFLSPCLPPTPTTTDMSRSQSGVSFASTLSSNGEGEAHEGDGGGSGPSGDEPSRTGSGKRKGGRHGPLEPLQKARAAFAREVGVCVDCRSRKVKVSIPRMALKAKNTHPCYVQCGHRDLSLFAKAYEDSKRCRSSGEHSQHHHRHRQVVRSGAARSPAMGQNYSSVLTMGHDLHGIGGGGEQNFDFNAPPSLVWDGQGQQDLEVALQTLPSQSTPSPGFSWTQNSWLQQSPAAAPGWGALNPPPFEQRNAETYLSPTYQCPRSSTRERNRSNPFASEPVQQQPRQPRYTRFRRPLEMLRNVLPFIDNNVNPSTVVAQSRQTFVPRNTETEQHIPIWRRSGEGYAVMYECQWGNADAQSLLPSEKPSHFCSAVFEQETSCEQHFMRDHMSFRTDDRPFLYRCGQCLMFNPSIGPMIPCLQCGMAYPWGEWQQWMWGYVRNRDASALDGTGVVVAESRKGPAPHHDSQGEGFSGMFRRPQASGYNMGAGTSYGRPRSNSGGIGQYQGSTCLSRRSSSGGKTPRSTSPLDPSRTWIHTSALSPVRRPSWLTILIRLPILMLLGFSILRAAAELSIRAWPACLSLWSQSWIGLFTEGFIRGFLAVLVLVATGRFLYGHVQWRLYDGPMHPVRVVRPPRLGFY